MEGCGGHGRGGQAAAVDGVAGAARGEHQYGKREREGQGAYLGPWLERGGRRAGWPLEAGAAGEGASGGGDARLRRGRVGAEQLVELEGDAEGLFYRR